MSRRIKETNYLSPPRKATRGAPLRGAQPLTRERGGRTNSGLRTYDYCFGVKRLFLSHTNHYWFALRTTTQLRANNYYSRGRGGAPLQSTQALICRTAIYEATTILYIFGIPCNSLYCLDSAAGRLIIKKR